MKMKKESLKQVISFLFIASIISTGIFIWMFNGARDSITAVLPIMYAPGISTIITALIFKDKIGNFGCKLGKARFLAYSYLLPIVVSILGYGLVWISEFSDFTTEAVMNYKWAKMLGLRHIQSTGKKNAWPSGALQ